MDGAIERAMADHYPLARFSISFVAVGAIHNRQKYSNEVVLRSIFYCKSFYNFPSPYLIIFLALIAGLRLMAIDLSCCLPDRQIHGEYDVLFGKGSRLNPMDQQPAGFLADLDKRNPDGSQRRL